MALTVQRLSQNADLGLTLVAGHAGADRVIDRTEAKMLRIGFPADLRIGSLVVERFG